MTRKVTTTFVAPDKAALIVFPASMEWDDLSAPALNKIAGDWKSVGDARQYHGWTRLSLAAIRAPFLSYVRAADAFHTVV